MTDDEKVRLILVERENDRLGELLGEVERKQDELHATELFLAAKQKFLTWVAGAVLVLTAFGMLSISSLVKTLSAKVEKEVTDQVIADMKIQLLDEHEQNILFEVTDHLSSRIEAAVDDQVTTELARIAENLRSHSDGQVAQEVAASIETTVEERFYYVIAGSSDRPQDLWSLREEVVDNLGTGTFERTFPHVEVCVQRSRPSVYVLILGPPMQIVQAQTLRSTAIRAGFRFDSFISQVSRYSCEGAP